MQPQVQTMISRLTETPRVGSNWGAEWRCEEDLWRQVQPKALGSSESGLACAGKRRNDGDVDWPLPIQSFVGCSSIRLVMFA